MLFADDGVLVAQEVKEAKLIDLSGEPLPRQQYDTSRWVTAHDINITKELRITLREYTTDFFLNFV